MNVAVLLRWTARAWSVASALFILAFVFGGNESAWPTGREAVGLLLFPVGVVVGFGISWWRESAGGLATLGSLAMFYLWKLANVGRLPPGPTSSSSQRLGF